jgi:hypothetical protein
VACLFLGPALPVAAQTQTLSCPIADDALAVRALGVGARGEGIQTNIAGLDACDFEDASGTAITVSRQNGAFGSYTTSGVAALAAMFIPDLPDTAQAQIAALSQTGAKVALPGFELSSLSGLGDAALWVKSDSGDSLLAQRGADAYAFETDDAPDAQAKLTALARAVLTTQ